MRITAINQATGEETFYTLRRGAVGLRLIAAGQPGAIQWEPARWLQPLQRAWQQLRGAANDARKAAPYAVYIRFDGRNATITDRGAEQRLYLLDQPLPRQQPWTWLPEQAVRYGDFILVWEITSADKSLLRQRTPLERLSPLLITLAILGLTGTLARFFYAGVQSRSNIIGIPTVTIFPIPTLTAAAKATATRTATPRPTPSLTSTITPTPTVATVLDERDRAATFTPSVTPTLLPAAATEAAARAICQATTPQPLPQQLVDLGIIVEPACVKVGEFYWRLTQAKWEETNGLHHVFIYLNSASPLDEKVTMRWETGACTREVKDAAGANCPMYNAGFAYGVQVEGLPSEKIINLGLGTVEQRDWTIRTSFHLTFTKTLHTVNSDN